MVGKHLKNQVQTMKMQLKLEKKYYEEVDFDSKEITLYATDYLKDTTIKSIYRRRRSFLWRSIYGNKSKS